MSQPPPNQQSNQTQPISLVGNLSTQQLLQNQITPQQLAAFQSQHQLQQAQGIRPGTVVNLNVGNQPMQVLGALTTATSLPINIISTGGQTFVQAATSNIPGNSHMQVRQIAPNAAAVVNQQLRAGNAGGISGMVHTGGGNMVTLQQQNLTDNSGAAGNRVNSPSLTVAGSKIGNRVGATGASLQNSGNSSSGAQQAGSSGINSPNTVASQVLTKRKLQDLLHEIDPRETMDDDVEELLLQVADDFIENVINSSCQVAKNRKSSTLDVKDVQIHLDRNWNMWIPGYGNEDLRPYKKLPSTEAHRQRLNLIKKALKK